MCDIEVIQTIVECGITSFGVGCAMGFAVIITDYVVTSVMSMLKGGV